MLCARHIEVRLGQRSVLADLDFEAAPGELTAIIGPNGSGKTTLLRALSGELAATGEVRLNGRDIRALKPWQLAERRAVLPQATALAFPFTVREVVGLGLGAGRRQGDAALAARALARVDLGDFGGRLYQDLSGGEQQRVQLARVLCQVWAPVLDSQPRYLFLDEPVSSLDIRHQLTIMDIARDFAGQGGGVVAILHDLNLAAMYADRLCVMHRGQFSATGAPGDILNDRLVETVFGCRLQVGRLPPKGMPFVLPQSVY
jgi:iron complex transport system ATP-binding protein